MQRDTTSNSVGLYVYGSRTLIPEPINAHADLDNTWHQFLTQTCGIEICPDDPVMVCSTSYGPASGRGWVANLKDKIGDFVSKYTVKKDKYSVRLAYGTANTTDMNATESAADSTGFKTPTVPPRPRQPVQASDNNKYDNCSRNTGKTQQHQKAGRIIRIGSSGIRIPSSNGHSPTDQPPTLTPQVPIRQSSTSGTVRHSVVGSHHVFQNMKRSSHHDRMQYAEDDMMDLDVGVGDVEDANLFFGVGHHQQDVEIGPLEDADEDEDDDGMSTCTAATVERGELRNAGVVITNVKPLVEDRLKRFNNNFLLRVQHEIRKLRKKQLWDRNVQRSPLACYLLQEIFKE